MVRHWYLDGMGIKIKLFSYNNKANMRDLLAATSLVILLKLDSNHRSSWPWNLMDEFKKQYGNSILHQALYIISNPWVNSNWSYGPEMLNLGRNWWYFVLCDLEIWWRTNSGQNWRFFVPRDLQIWWMTLINNGAPFQNYIKLCASFQSHEWIQTGVTVRKNAQFGSKSAIFCPVWPWNLTDDLEKP